MKKVAAYARVSTNKRNQETSFQYQSDYWNEILTKNDDYEYVGLFADKGISGKYATRRPQFMALIEEAERGNIDIIFTKSVQRFARNTEELLSIVKRLREKEIAIIFEKENINSLDDICLKLLTDNLSKRTRIRNLIKKRITKLTGRRNFTHKCSSIYSFKYPFLISIRISFC